MTGAITHRTVIVRPERYSVKFVHGLGCKTCGYGKEISTTGGLTTLNALVDRRARFTRELTSL